MKAKVKLRGIHYRHVVKVHTTTESQDKNDHVKEAIKLAVFARLNTKNCDIIKYKPFIFSELGESPQFWEGLLKSNGKTYSWFVEEII